MDIESLKEKDKVEMYELLLKNREEKLAQKRDAEGVAPEEESLIIEPSDIELTNETTEYIMKKLNLPIPSEKYIGFTYNKDIIVNTIIRFKNIIADFDLDEDTRLKFVNKLVDIAPYINVFKNIQHVYILNGYGSSGKDTFVKYCDEALAPMRAGCMISSVGGIIKIGKIFKPNIDMQHRSDEDRRFFFDLKKVVTEYCDFCRRYVLQEIVKADIKGYTHLFIDIRELEEIDKAKEIINRMLHPHFKNAINYYMDDPVALENAKKYYSVRTIFLVRDDVISDADNPATVTQKFNQYIRSHCMYIENYDYDWVIENNGTLEDFKETCRKFIQTEVDFGNSDFKNLKFSF